MSNAVPIERRVLPGRKSGAQARRLLLVWTAFAVLLSTGVHHRRDLGEFLHGWTSRPGLIQGAGRPGLGETIRPLDPRSEFAETRVGLMLFSAHNTDFCRRVMFDNRTGTSAEAGQIHYGQPPEHADQIGQERTLALLRAFRK